MSPTREPRRITLTPGARRALEAASRLFYERGIHAVGVDLIAAEAGVTKKTLYDRFGSKDQLVVEYLAARDERWRAFLAERLEAVSPGPDDVRPPGVERVLAVFDASRAWMEANSPRGCSMVNAHAEIDDRGHPAYSVIAGQKTWMLELFTRLAREAEARTEAEAQTEAQAEDEAKAQAEDKAEDEGGTGKAEQLGRTLMLLHEGALVAHGLRIFPDALGEAREQARALLT
ncbi:TetR/AcrR family transcriptional regulator [Streptomyces sp. NPDC088551]|uniref:TetR/AcrR family transcriptional regulator n=1 Tax=Streptomyces sp. NPDC088551 TaxID=3365863 RepID=UPI0037FA0CFA